jgi:hypothetical protein
MHVRRALAPLTVVLAALLVSAPAQAAQPGVVSDITWWGQRSSVDTEVAKMQDLGVSWARLNVNWAELEPNQGSYDPTILANIDYAVKKTMAAGIQVVMPLSDGTPCWASADPNRNCSASNWNHHYPPRAMSDYADAARFMVSRYAPLGVHDYEVWNEPNHPYFWQPQPSASGFASMLKAAYPAIKAADPRSTVILGGLTGNDYNYLDAVYRAGGGPYFDAVAVHPYTQAPPEKQWKSKGNDGGSTGKLSPHCFPAFKEVYRTMVANGDASKSIWLTEFGWSTNNVSQAQQADYLTRAYKYLDAYPYVKVALWYSARNDPYYSDSNSGTEAQLGLMTTNFTPKPAYTAMRDVAHGIVSTTQPTKTAPLTVRLTSPQGGSRFTRKLAMAAKASDYKAVTKVAFLVDGVVRAVDRSAPFSSTWRVSGKLARSAHRVTVKARAFDADGHTATSKPITVRSGR